MTENTPKNASDVLRSLHEFIIGPEEDVTETPIEQVHEYLKSEGIDPAPLVTHVRQRILKLKAERELALAREERMNYAQRLSSHGEKVSPTGLREKIQNMIQGLTIGNPELATVYFRKFEEASDSDLESLLEDLALLEEMAADDASKQSR
ncbi:MAG: hypothetical protein PHD54_13110 [Desulfuromonadaceae bacterium]|nr:hypothetical protein [Desulfuromonadaceae bacterium]